MANAGIVQQTSTMMSESLAGGFVDDDGGGGRRRRSKRHKDASQRRKIEKAQEHLRSRMQHRLKGPAMVSARLQKSRKRGGNIEIHDDNKADDMLRVKTFKGAKRELEKAADSGFYDANKQLTGNYWRTQQDRYSNATHHSKGTRTSMSQDDIPLHELVDRVLRKKEQQNNISAPLTIRAYKQPKAPYILQQQPMIKKMVGGQAVGTSRKHPKNKGPYFVVLHGENPEKVETNGLASIRGNSVDNNSVEVDINAWPPQIGNNVRRSYPDDDRGVTNYKLQMQHAARLAEARFDYSNSSKKMQTFNTLPPISNKLPQEQLTRRKNNNKVLENVVDGTSEQTGRVQSSDEILQAMRDIKRAKKQPSGNDFNTILRTRNRYTAKTRQFKEGISKARALSAIDEDQSSVSSERTSRCLSGRRPSQSSLRSLSAQSLNRIDETKTPEPDDMDIQNVKEQSKSSYFDRNANDIIEEGDEADSDEDVFMEESSEMSQKLKSASKQSREPVSSLQLSLGSNPLPPIQIKVASPTKHDRQVTDDETSTQLKPGGLPTMPVVPEIRNTSAGRSISDAAA